MVRKNRFTKALKHLKSTELDEKIQSLKEAPTNKTTGVYSLGATNVDLGPYKPPKIFLPDKDGNFPAGIPGNAGDPYYERPAGYWSGGRDWDNVAKSDYSHAKIVAGGDNTSTAGLISDSGGVQTRLPPNSRHFILGPIVDGYVYNHGYDNYTNIGYLQKDTRQFVLLGRIYGQWKSGVINNTDNVWNGTSFTAYNPEFTLEMAQWIKTEIDANRFYKDVPYHYSGGVPQQQPNWLDNFFNGMFGGLGFGGGGNGGSASDAKPGAGGYGSGGQPGIGQQRDPDSEDNHGNSGDNNLWGNIWDDLKDHWGNVWDDLTNHDDVAQFGEDLLDMLDDIKEQIPALDYAVDIAESVLKNEPIDNSDSISQSDKDNLIDNLNYNNVSINDEKVPYADGNIITDENGSVRPRNQWPTDENGDDIMNTNDMTQEQYDQMMAWSDDNKNHPNNTGPVHTEESEQELINTMGQSNPLAAQGQAQTQVYTNENGQQIFSYNDHAYHNLTSDDPGEVPGIGFINPKDWLSSAVHAVADALHGRTEINNTNAASSGQYSSGELGVPQADTQAENTGGMAGYPSNIRGDSTYSWEEPVENLSQEFQDWLNNQNSNNQSSSNSSNGQLISQNNAQMPQYVKDSIKRQYSGKDYSIEDKKNILNWQQRIRASNNSNNTQVAHYKPQGEVLSENKKRLLREIKRPVLIEETPKTKLKGYRPNFKGKFTPQNTPNVTACKKSDELALGANARGQKWREEDKYWKGYETTERMNVIHDRMGHSSMAWDAIIDEARNKNGWKNREIQEQLNRYYALKAEREMGYIQEEEDPNQDEIDKYMKDPLVKRVRKRLLTQIDYPDKPSKKGYPDQPPKPQMGGWHSEYGKRKDYYKKLDPVSALAMPTQGDPEIDAEVEKQKKKYVKPKVAEDTRENWRDSLTNA